MKTVKAEDWYYGSHQDPRDPGDPGDPQYPSNSPLGKTMEYGKTYLVTMKTGVENFNWHNSGIRKDVKKPEKPENFSFEEKASYEDIDILEVEGVENVTEIGIFENDICVGAKKVEEFPVQILAYTDEYNRDSTVLSFQIVTERGLSEEVPNYAVYDFAASEWEYREIISRRQEHSLVRLEAGDYEDVTPIY